MYICASSRGYIHKKHYKEFHLERLYCSGSYIRDSLGWQVDLNSRMITTTYNQNFLKHVNINFIVIMSVVREEVRRHWQLSWPQPNTHSAAGSRSTMGTLLVDSYHIEVFCHVFSFMIKIRRGVRRCVPRLAGLKMEPSVF